jgi:hypothetical protein
MMAAVVATGNGGNMDNRMDSAAREALNKILGRSIEERKECGGMIYEQHGFYHAMPPLTQGNPTTVNVGQDSPNCGCPPGTMPVAYYHTHPTYSVAGLRADYNVFSDADKDVALDHNLVAAYAGTLDGSFLKFDCKSKIVTTFHARLKNTTS